jgi:type I site-specific restriction endonuclease
MAEYQRSKLEQQQRAFDGKEFDAVPTSFNDEEIRRRELKQQKADVENKEFQQLKQKMASNKDIQGDMRRQAQLSTELQLAFKRGDSATVKRLERKLAPDEAKMTVKHPWA